MRKLTYHHWDVLFKYFLIKFLLLFIFLSLNAISQQFIVSENDTSDFPIIHSNFIIIDGSNKKVTGFGINDFNISEDGINRKILRVNCPETVLKRNLSLTVLLDNSNSMSGTKLELAKKVAKKIIELTIDSYSECALIAFNEKPIVLNDFSNDIDRLNNNLDRINTYGIVNYDEAFLNAHLGAIEVSKSNKKERYIVFISDGYGDFDFTNHIIEIANKNNIRIYFIFVSDKTPVTALEIAKSTNGRCLSNVVTEDLSIGSAYNLSDKIKGKMTCTIDWESIPSCNLKNTNVKFIHEPFFLNTLSTILYPKKSLTVLSIEPIDIIFKNEGPGKLKDTIVTISAVFSDVYVKNIKSSNPDFEVIPNEFYLQSGESKECVLTFRPSSLKYSKCSFEIQTEYCDTSFVAQGISTYSNNGRNLRIIEPNGNEKYTYNDSVNIKWTGVLPTDTIKILYSNNNGNTWAKITDLGTGLQHLWIAPDTLSNEYLLKLAYGDSSDAFYRVISFLDNPKWAISSDNQKIVCSLDDGSVFLFNATDGKLTKEFKQPGVKVNNIAMSEDGHLLAVNGKNELTYIWNLDSGELLKTINNPKSFYSKLCFSPNKKYFANGMNDNEKSISIYDISTGEQVTSIRGISKDIYCLKYDKEGKKIYAGYLDGQVKVWDISTGMNIVDLPKLDDMVSHISFSHDYKLLVTSSTKGTLNLIDNTTYSLLKNFDGAYNELNPVVFTNDNKRLICLLNRDIIKIIDIETGEETTRFKGHSDRINLLSLSPDGNSFLSAADDQRVIKWDLNTGQPIKTVLNILRHNSNITSVRISPDGLQFISGCQDNTIKLWDLPTQQPVFTFYGHTGSVNSVDYSPDGNKFVSGGNDSFVNIWNIKSENILHSFKAHEDRVENVLFSPNGKNILSCSFDRCVKLWDAETGQLIRNFTGHKDGVRQIAFNSNGTMFASGSTDRTIRIWDIDSIQPLTIINDSAYYHLPVFFSSDDSSVIVSYENVLKEWNIYSGKLIKTYKPKENNVITLALTPDRTLAASYSYIDKKYYLWIWDLNSGVIIDSYQQVYGSSNDISFNVERSLILSSHSNSMILRKYSTEAPQLNYSDTTWSIAPPNLRATDVNCGKSIINARKDTLITGFIKNFSDRKVQVENIIFEGDDKSSFQIVNKDLPFTLYSNEEKSIRYRFIPMTVGDISCTITIISQADTIKYSIGGEGLSPKILLLKGFIDFGSVPLGTIKSGSFAIFKNIIDNDINIFNIVKPVSSDEQFDFHLTSTSFSIKSNDSLFMNISFSPQYIGRVSDFLTIYYDSLYPPAAFYVYGKGVDLNLENNQLIIYPNPSSDQTTIMINIDKKEKINLYMYDILGKKTFKIFSGIPDILPSEFQVNLKEYAPGVYYIVMHTINEVYVNKIIILR